MSVAAVLAHEYYGHRPNREEYLKDYNKKDGTYTTPIWQDECRASINAAKTAKNLTQIEKQHLVMDATYRANEAGHLIESDDFMKEVLYGYSKEERNITYELTPIKFVSKASEIGNEKNRKNKYGMSNMQRTPQNNHNFSR